MRKLVLSGTLLLSAMILSAAGPDPLNIKPGLWQVTMTSKVSSLPQPNTSTYQSCIKKEDLAKYPFTDPDANCNWNVLSSTGTQMEAKGMCRPQGMGNVTFNMKLEATDSENVKGTGQLTFDGPGGVINGTYSGTAKWKSASCPANLK
jgi:hypothetical protein